jgi:hypothetical protein
MIAHAQLSRHKWSPHDEGRSDGCEQAELLQSLYSFHWLETISLFLSKRLATAVQFCDGSLHQQQTPVGGFMVVDPEQ